MPFKIAAMLTMNSTVPKETKIIPVILVTPEIRNKKGILPIAIFSYGQSSFLRNLGAGLLLTACNLLPFWYEICGDSREL